jgi:ATP-dependent RNA helicase RhlE
VLFVEQGRKRSVLEQLLRSVGVGRTLVFTKTKRGANRVSEDLSRSGFKATAIHGNKSQAARQRALEEFRRDRVQVLVATDVAARGIDVDGITHVVNFELPLEPENYIHRIGRTGRAGASGIALSFCSSGERGMLRDIERLIGRKVEVDGDHPQPQFTEAESSSKSPGQRKSGARPRGGRWSQSQSAASNGGSASRRRPRRKGQRTRSSAAAGR